MELGDRTHGIVPSFISRAPAPELVDVLILPHVDPDVESQLAQNTGFATIDVIDDQSALLQRCEHLERHLKFARPRRAASEFLSAIFSLSYSPEGVPGSFRFGVFDWMGSSESGLAPVYVIRRNRVQDQTLSRFLSTFRLVPPLRRPKIVIDAEYDVPAVRALLRMSRDSTSVFFPAPDGLRRGVINSQPSDVTRFPEAIVSGALSACADADLPEPLSGSAVEERRRYAMFLYQRVQAKKGCDRKFDAAGDIRRLERFLRNELGASHCQKDRAWFAEALAFALLDRSYVLEEGARPVENALAIAQELEDLDLHAWILRHVNISAGVSPFASEMLREAALSLQDQGRFTQSAYAATNRTITDLHRIDAPIDLPRAEAVVEYILDWAPYCERLSSIINAAGVAALISGNLQRAEDLFKRAMTTNGGRLHRISAEMNILITHHVGGTRVTADAVERVFRSILRAKMSRKLDYHHVYLLANLVALTRSRRLKSEMRSHLLQAKYMNYPCAAVTEDRLLPFLATQFRMIADGNRFRGHRGAFVEDFGLLPLAQFIWN